MMGPAQLEYALVSIIRSSNALPSKYRLVFTPNPTGTIYESFDTADPRPGVDHH